MFIGRGQEKIYYTIKKSKKKQTEPKLFILMHGLSVDHNHPMIKYMANRFSSFGDVLTFDFSGYGLSGGGVPSRRYRKFVQDIQQITDWVKKQSKFKKHKVFLVGHSAGAVVGVIHAARKNPNIDGLVVVAGNAESERAYRMYKKLGLIKVYDDYTTLFGRHQLAKNFWDDRKHFEPLKLVRKIKVPTLYIYGSKDRVNPVSDGKKFMSKTKAPKELVIVKGAGHNFKDLKHRQALVKAIKQWALQLV